MRYCQGENGSGKVALNISVSSKHSSAREVFALGQGGDVWQQKRWWRHTLESIRLVSGSSHTASSKLSHPSPFPASIAFPVQFPSRFTGEAVPFEWQREGRPGPRGQGSWGTVWLVLSYLGPSLPLLPHGADPFLFPLHCFGLVRLFFLPISLSFSSFPFPSTCQTNFGSSALNRKKIYNENFKNI